MLEQVIDYGYETDSEYREWTYSDEYSEMTNAYYLDALKKENLKQVV